jgi:hypothetical protein
MIDLALSKENAAPPHFWGMLYDGWAPDPKEGTTVFITGYDQRGPDNERKKIYASATTPDLYAAQYAGKVHGFLTRLFADANAGKPLMHEYNRSIQGGRHPAGRGPHLRVPHHRHGGQAVARNHPDDGAS